MPDSTPSDIQHLNGIIHDDTNTGAPVYSFDPEAPPQVKAAKAGKAMDRLKGPTQSREDAREVSLETSGGPPVLPTITISDVDKVHVDQQNFDSIYESTGIPGAISDALASSIPEWYRVGWRAVGSVDIPADQLESDKHILAAFIKEQYYGEWYHNAGIIFFAVLMSHFLTLFNMGWGSLLVLLAFCSTYYTTSLARVRRRARDDIQRDLVKTRLISEHESADWINHFLDRFWLIYEPVLSATIVSSVDQILSANTPPFLDSIRLTTFTLGTKAPRIDKVRTFPKTEDDIVMMDWGISFTPNDVSDLTARQAAAKVNPKIVLNIRLGKGFATAGMPILLEDISFTGLMRIRLKLMTSFPHVKVVDISFIEKPLIDYVLKPLGDTFGFDIASIPGLSSFIREMTHTTLGPMMYDPNVFTVNLEQMLSGTPLDAAIGVLQVTIHTARALKGTRVGGGTPDPFVSLSINHRAELARTEYKCDTYNPTWHETKFLLINSLTEALSMDIMDYNDHRKHHSMGTATFELAKLNEDATQEDLVADVLKDGKEKGQLRFDISFYPVLTPTKVDGVETPLPETSVGIVRLVIHQAKDLDHTKSLSGDLNPLAKVFLGSSHQEAHTTPRFKHTNNPVWESHTEFLCPDRASSVISIKVIDDRDFLPDPVVGHMSVKLNDLLEAKKATGKDWWPLSGCKSGRLRLGIEWKPLNMAGSLHGATQYHPPIGVIKLWVQKATDVKNVEAALGGKSDPYVRVLSNNVIVARTEVINNNLNPVWDQIVYVPVHSLKEAILLECMDYQHLTKDRSLGSVELRASDLTTASVEDKDYPYASLGKKAHVERIQLDKGDIYKGELHFVTEFVPALFLKDVKFDAQSNELPRAVDTQADEKGSMRSASSKGSKSDTPVPATRNELGSSFSPGHTKDAETYTANTVATEATAPENYEGAEMTTEELLKHQSGLIVFNLIGGKLAKKSRLEVLLDEGYWPAMVTPKSRSTRARFDQVGEGFVKELDFSQIWLRLNESDDPDKEIIVAEVKIDAKTFLEQSMDGPFKFTLRDHDGRQESVVEISSRYVPVNITLEPRESINNHGILRIELVEGRDIPAVDRGGKSDPYAVFTLNGHKVFRSQVKKKTLNPEWDEWFETNVMSRVGSHFAVEVYDWNQIEQSKLLGTGVIELESLEPFQGRTKSIPLSTPKGGVKGEVRINLLFQPGIIAKSRKSTSTFSTAGRAMTQVGGLPIGAGKGIVHGVGNAGRTVRNVFKRDHGSKASLEVPHQNDQVVQNDSHEEISTVQVSRMADSADKTAALPVTGALPSPSVDKGSQPPREYGMLKVTVLAAKDLSGVSSGETVKPYVVIKVGDKEQKTKHAGKTTTPEWDETFRFLAGPETKSLIATIFDHKTLGKDRPLGEADVDPWHHLQSTGLPVDVWVELREGQGLLRLRLDFERGRPSSGSVSSFGPSPTSSPSRFTSLRKSTTRDRT